MAEDTGLTSADVAAGDDGNASQYNDLRTDIKALRQASVTAGETINGATLPVPVYKSTADGEYYACDGNDNAKNEYVGFAITNGTDGNPIIVQFSGIVGGFSSLTAGALYYVSDTAGVLATTPGTNYILVGVAISTTQILIIREKDRVVKGSFSMSRNQSEGTGNVDEEENIGFRPKYIVISASGSGSGGSSNTIGRMMMFATQAGAQFGVGFSNKASGSSMTFGDLSIGITSITIEADASFLTGTLSLLSIDSDGFTMRAAFTISAGSGRSGSFSGNYIAIG